MRKPSKPRSKLSIAATLSLLILLSLLCSCVHKPSPVLIPVGEVEIVGKVKDGNLTYNPGVDPKKEFYIVTPAFILKFVSLALEVRELETENRELRKKISK